MNAILKEIKLHTETILDRNTTPIVLLNACNSLFDLFTELTHLNAEKIATRETINTANGDAIGTIWAAMCLKDNIRTKQFIKGLHRAITDKLTDNKNRPIRILYAGTGPFATLAIPMMTLFSSDEISFTFLEINTETITHLKVVIEALGAENYVENIIQCDASEYQLKDTNFDIFLTETMQNSLRKEPQVPIAINFMKQLPANTIMIPETIVVKATLNDLGKEANEFSSDTYLPPLVLENLIQFDKSYIDNFQKDSSFPLIEVMLSEVERDHYHDICLVTEITTYKDLKIKYKESGLTMPEKIDALQSKYEKINFQYTLGKDPGFKTTIL